MNIIIISTSKDVELSIGRDAFDIKVGVIDVFKMREGFNDSLLSSISAGSGEFGGIRSEGINVCFII